MVGFEDNRLASDLYGQYDQHLALIEQRLGIEATARGNYVSLRGDRDACATAAEVLEGLYQRLLRGEDIGPGDVDGAIRVATAVSEQQAVLPGLSSLAQIGTRKKTVTARTVTQDRYLRALNENDLVFAAGPAGTGKTYLAVAYAASLLEKGMVDRIILSRPAVEAGERLGFLPGDMREKVDPYLRPLYDALYDMMPTDRVERGVQNRVIEIAPLAFMRGRTLSNAAVILDEAQNCTTMQMKMFLTRLGEGSKMIITGDPSQVDLPPGQKSGLREAIDLLASVEGVAHIAFMEQDVVRNALVQRIVRAYEKAEAAQGARRGGA
ncbi:Phosphate starvation-inducible ATPase PhoH with RNA binding protein [Lutibaculum baratangense AMV1]|uniref:PhoH-like protein n=1 Tax=Lutibaculum baratangense AMV1 TaxID=631454 RepID=V4TIX8_9HYPH|nr:PhoH family protein [Lutibaculum baratangense]ESR25878.1 Phosphate starvation-inducible ATPase PhoH with RNA binding protein [Lutibaculum baratangense AMV1]